MRRFVSILLFAALLASAFAYSSLLPQRAMAASTSTLNASQITGVTGQPNTDKRWGHGYWKGYHNGYSDGYEAGLTACYGDDHHHHGWTDEGDWSYRHGYSDGYEKGYDAGMRDCDDHGGADHDSHHGHHGDQDNHHDDHKNKGDDHKSKGDDHSGTKH